jgi:hypothetical protein
LRKRDDPISRAAAEALTRTAGPRHVDRVERRRVAKPQMHSKIVL